MGKNTKKKKQNAGANSPGDQSALLPAGVEKKQAAESEEMMGMLEHDAVAEAASAVEEVTEEQTRGNRRMEGVVWSGAAKHENLDDRPSPSHAGAAPTPALPAATQYSPPPATTNENSGDQSAVRPTSPRPAEVETNSFLLLLEESEETRGMLKKDEVEAAASAAEEAFPSHSRELSQVGEEDKEEETHGIRRMEGVQEQDAEKQGPREQTSIQDGGPDWAKQEMARSHFSSSITLIDKPTYKEARQEAELAEEDKPYKRPTLVDRIQGWEMWKLSPTLVQKQMGAILLIAALGLMGFVFGGQPDTANDFSCQAWNRVIDTLHDSPLLQHATLIVGHATSNMIVLRKGNMAPGLASRMPIASATKWVTAATLMRLVENGTLSLADKPSKYLPWWNPTTRPSDKRAQVTLHHLLSMTSSLTSKPTHACTRGAASLEGCARLVFEDNAPAANRSRSPAVGSDFVYSGNHLVVAAAMAEAATGSTFQRLFEELVARRLLFKDEAIYATADFLLTLDANDMAANGQSCESSSSWQDRAGDGCIEYELNSENFCAVADLYAIEEMGEDGILRFVDASDKCCACGGGTHSALQEDDDEDEDEDTSSPAPPTPEQPPPPQPSSTPPPPPPASPPSSPPDDPSTGPPTWTWPSAPPDTGHRRHSQSAIATHTAYAHSTVALRAEHAGESCESDLEWRDSGGDGCAGYTQNADSWCPMADTYSVHQQQDASSKCCACGGGQRGSGAGGLECGSDAEWEDARGSTCARYDTNAGMCRDAEQYAVTVEVTASDVCCACGGGLHAVNKESPSPPPTVPPLLPSLATSWQQSYAHSEWRGTDEVPEEVDVSGGLLISPRDYARFLRALLPTVEAPDEIAAGQTEYLQYKSLLSDESRRVFFGTHTSNASLTRTLSSFVGGRTWDYAYGHWVECDTRQDDDSRRRESRDTHPFTHTHTNVIDNSRQGDTTKEWPGQRWGLGKQASGVFAEGKLGDNTRAIDIGKGDERRALNSDALDEDLCHDSTVQSSMGAMGFYPLVVLDEDVEAENKNYFILIVPALPGAAQSERESAMLKSVEFRQSVHKKVRKAVPYAMALQGSPWEGQGDDDEESVCRSDLKMTKKSDLMSRIHT